MGGILYFHGFCSSAKSAKGTFLAAKFAERGVAVELPDLDGGSFRDTTLSKQLALAASLAERIRPDTVIGSSLGGYLAALLAARQPLHCPSVALLAPAFDFGTRLSTGMGPALEQWERSGEHSFFHYRDQRDLPLSYAFLEDARRYEPYPDVQVPAIILHGEHDESVPASLSQEFARSRPNVQLRLLDSDHQLLDRTAEVWSELWDFCQGVWLRAAAPPGPTGGS